MAAPTRCFVPFRQPLLFQPVETATPYSFSRVIDEARSIWFPEIEDEVETRIASLGPLASIWPHRMGRERHVVVFHPILNRSDVPFEVVRFIAKHELTHIAVPGPGHSNRFWDKEHEISPEQRACWKWISANLGRAMVHNPSGLWLRHAWRERVARPFAPYTPHLPFEDNPWSTLCPGGGAQLRFDPVWSRGPAPLASPFSLLPLPS